MTHSKLYPALFSALLMLVTEAAIAGEWDYIVGYRFVDLDHQYDHDTHPNDSFLPDATIPGSAGTTKLGNTHWLSVGGRYQTIMSGLLVNFDLAFLLGGDRDETKNANDARPAPTAAFIYSSAHFGGTASAGLSFDLNPFLLGVEAQIMGIYIEDGWDRFDRDKKDNSTFKIVSTIGPKIAYRFEEHMGLEATLQIGEQNYSAMSLVWGL